MPASERRTIELAIDARAITRPDPDRIGENRNKEDRWKETRRYSANKNRMNDVKRPLQVARITNKKDSKFVMSAC